MTKRNFNQGWGEMKDCPQFHLLRERNSVTAFLEVHNVISQVSLDCICNSLAMLGYVHEEHVFFMMAVPILLDNAHNVYNFPRKLRGSNYTDSEDPLAFT